MNHPEINIGIDTSQSQLDIGVRPSDEFFCVPNNDVGIKEAIKRIKVLKPQRVLIESTGRLEMAFACAAFNAGLPIVVCNALVVHMKPQLTQIKPEKLQRISDLIAVRSQCLHMSTQQKNRLKRMPKSVHAPIQRVLKSIQKEVEWLDKKLDKAIAQVPYAIERAARTWPTKSQRNCLARWYCPNESR